MRKRLLQITAVFALNNPFAETEMKNLIVNIHGEYSNVHRSIHNSNVLQFLVQDGDIYTPAKILEIITIGVNTKVMYYATVVVIKSLDDFALHSCFASESKWLNDFFKPESQKYNNIKFKVITSSNIVEMTEAGWNHVDFRNISPFKALSQLVCGCGPSDLYLVNYETKEYMRVVASSPFEVAMRELIGNSKTLTN